MSKENENGVWRTIRGRRIFIADGQSLGEAMTKSGKFNRSDIRETKQQASFDDTADKVLKAKPFSRKQVKAQQKYTGKYGARTINSYNQAPQNRINESSKRWTGGKTRVEQNYDRYSQEDRRELKHENLQKKLVDYRNNTMSKNIGGWTIQQEDNMHKEGRQARESIYQQAQKEKSQKAIADFKAKKQSNNKIDNKQFEVSELKQKALERLPKEDIDTHDSDLYIKKTKESEALISNMKDKDSGLLTTFKDQNTGETWYEVPFANMSDDFKEKQSNNDYTQDTAKERISYNTARDLLNQLNNEGSDFTFGEIEVDKYNKDFKEDGNIKTEVSVFMPDDRGYVSRELNIPIDKNETRASLEEKLRDWQDRHNSPDSFYDDDFNDKKTEVPGFENYELNERTGEVKIKDSVRKGRKKDEKDWLPKATEIKEQGKSNRKEVSDNIQAHILEHYGPDYTGDDSISAEQAFIDQMDAMSWLPNNWKRGEEIAKGGSYLVYNQDMADFLDSLKINPKGKKFSDDKAFNMYTSLIGRESAKLYDRIKKHQAETINNYKKKKGK